MKSIFPIVLITATMLLVSGCATPQRGNTTAQTGAKPMPAYIAQEASTMPLSANASSQGTLEKTVRPANVQQEPVPIWEPAEVVRVELAPYVNEKGEAFPASYKYVVVKGGSFNTDALEKPEQSYIPSDNIPRVPGNPSMTYSRMVSPGSGSVHQPSPTGATAQGLQTKALYDLSQVMIIGLFESSQGSEARAMVPDDYVAVYDKNLGWIGIPKSHLMGVGEIQSRSQNVQ